MIKKTVMVILALILVSLVFVRVERKGTRKPVLSEKSTPTPTQTIQKSGWKTYESPRFGYSFSYPENWFASFYDESDPEVLFGTHTLTNYDVNKVIEFMDHGMVDWEKFLGDAVAVKIDLSAQNLDNMSREEFIEQYYSEATLQPKSDLKFGQFETVQYNTPGAINDQLVRSYISFLPDSKVLTASIYIYNQPDQVLLQDTAEWNEIEAIFSTFFYSSG